MQNNIILSVNNIQKYNKTFSYISNNSEYVVNSTLENERLTDSREAHNKYHLPNRIPTIGQEYGWFLEPLVQYKFISNTAVIIPEGSIGLVSGKSSLSNNGINVIPMVLNAGNYETIEVDVYNNYGISFIERDTNIAEIVLLPVGTFNTVQKSVEPKVEPIKKVAEPSVTSEPEIVVESKVETVANIENTENVNEGRKRR